LSGGIASISTSSLTVATHSITAVYGVSANFTGSTSNTVSQVVNQAATSSALVSSVNPSVYGQSVTFTDTVSAVAPGAGTPTGTVQFVIDGVNSGSPVSLTGNTATLSTSSLSVGPHTIKAVYSGDGSFVPSTSSTFSLTTSKANTQVAITSSAN